MRLRTLIIVIAALISEPGYAYNFLYIHPTTGKPIGWEKGTTIRYYLDPGSLGKLTNDQAHTLLKEAMKVWENASPYANVPKFEFAGYLPEDVNGTNYQKYVSLFPCYTDDLSSCKSDAQKNLQTVIVFDEDGSIMRNELCRITACSASSGARVFEKNQSIKQGISVFGPTVVPAHWDTEEGVSVVVGLMVHELGHLLGLAHSLVNQDIDISGDVSQYAYLPTLDQTNLGADAAALNPDEIAGISVLYPSDDFGQNTATIKGKILKSDGSAMMHVNVVARNVQDPLCEAYSFLSGRLCQRPFGTESSAQCQTDQGTVLVDGNFVLSGLPSGSYTIEVGEIADKNLALALSPGLVNEFIAGDAEFWNEGDQANEANTLSSTITLSAGETKENVNIILNRSAVTADRIKYIPLSTFTAGPGTRCQPSSTNFASLIGITDTSSDPSSSTTESRGCSLIQ